MHVGAAARSSDLAPGSAAAAGSATSASAPVAACSEPAPRRVGSGRDPCQPVVAVRALPSEDSGCVRS